MILNQFPVSRWRVYYTAQEPLHLNEYSGSMWRGVISKALWEIACTTQRSDCTNCPYLSQCAYPKLFDCPGSSVNWGIQSHAPGGWLIEPNLTDNKVIQPNTPHYFDFVLIGEAQQHVMLAIEAIKRGFYKGVGPRRARCLLNKVYLLREDLPEKEAECMFDGTLNVITPQAHYIHIPPLLDSSPLTIQLLTPLRLKTDNKLIGPREFRAELFLKAAYRRITLLAKTSNCHLATEWFDRVDTSLKNIEMTDLCLHWQDWVRYSSRQKTKMNLGGLVGSFKLKGELAPAWPILYLSQWVHVGKSTAFGLGKIQATPTYS